MHIFTGLSKEEVKERVLQSMLEAGATPEAIAKVMVQQELLQVIGKSPEDLSKQLLKQLRSGEDISLQELKKVLESGGMTIEDAGKVLVLQKAMSALNSSVEDIAKACLLQKSLINVGTPMEEVMDMINTALKESGIDITNINMDELISNDMTVDQIMNSFAFDKVLEAGGMTLDGLRQENASKSSVSNAVKEMLHSTGATPEGIAGALLLQKIMTSMEIAPTAVAKMILLEKSLYNSGTSPQDIIHLLHKVAENQKVDVNLASQIAKEQLPNKVNAKNINAVCDLVDAFHGARVAPEITSKIIMLQKAIESGITSPETDVKSLSEQLMPSDANAADFVDAFTKVLEKNGIEVGDAGKAALIQKAATGAGVEASALSVLMDIQNSLIAAGLSPEQVSKVMSELIKDVDIASISKNMLTSIENNARPRDEDFLMGCKIADAFDRASSGNSKFAKLLAKQNLKGLSPVDLAAVINKLLQDNHGPNSDSLGKALALQALMSNSNGDSEKLAKALRISNALVRNGVPKSNISRLFHQLMEENPSIRKQVLEDIKKPLKQMESLITSPTLIAFSQKYQSAITEAIANVDNLKDIFENAMLVVGLTKEDVAKAALVQKTLSASGVTPAVLAQAVLFQRALSASGLSPEEIVGILSKVTSPKFTEDEITLLLTKVLEKRHVSKDDIEAISKIQKALRNGNLGFGGESDASKITDELKNLIAAGEVDLEILGKAVLMQKILSVSGLSPEDLGKAILLQQGNA